MAACISDAGTFYSDWKFWSVVISTAALILSQLPPLHILFRSAKLDVETLTKMHFTHKLGNPNAQMHLIVRNVGGRDTRIKKITAHFSRGNEQFSIPAQAYLQNQDDKTPILFAPFKLKPKEEWAHLINFVASISREDEKLVNGFKTALNDDLAPKIKMRQKKKNEDPNSEDTLIEADPSIVKPILEYFNRKFVWKTGDYNLTISVEAEPKKASTTRKYRFTVFESDAAELFKASEDIKYGFDVSLNALHNGVVLPIEQIF